MIEKRRDLLFAHRGWMSAAVKEHKSPDPTAVRHLGSPAVMTSSESSSYLLEQSKTPSGIR
jgi:hypothetical protein